MDHCIAGCLSRARGILDRSLGQAHHALHFLAVLRERGLPELHIGLLQVLQRAAIVDRAEQLHILAQSHADKFGPLPADVLHGRSDLRVELRGFVQHGSIHLAHACKIGKWNRVRWLVEDVVAG
jgi:hypothetical protein